MIIASQLRLLGPFPHFPQEVIREELSQPRTSVTEARSGGPAHRAFIDLLPEAWRSDPQVEIFSRCLYLKEGWYPLSPHFHFDWGRGADAPFVETLMVCMGDASLTEFILGPLDLPEADPAGGRRRGGGEGWDAQVAAGLASGALRSWRIEPWQLVLFDNRTLHRARPAGKTGWRLLLRAIRGLERMADGADGGYGRRAPFTTCRNGYVPETAEERRLHAAYREDA
ncbi:MAG: hypothetical protein J0M02_05035 [Planctomycetes bacterium]|nr:hypothetical protein [Planctomycetota bacterium]